MYICDRHAVEKLNNKVYIFDRKFSTNFHFATLHTCIIHPYVIFAIQKYMNKNETKLLHLFNSCSFYKLIILIAFNK